MNWIKKFKIIERSKSPEAVKLYTVVADQVFMSIATLLTTIVLARTYAKTDYADIVLLFSLALFILGFQSALISKPYAINLNDFEGEESRKYFHFSLQLKSLLTLGIVIGIPLVVVLIYQQISFIEGVLFVLYIATHSTYYFIRETLLSERRTRQNLKYGIAVAVSIIVLLLIILVFKLEDIRIFLSFTSGIYGFFSLYFLYNNASWRGVLRKIRKHYWQMNWRVGKWLVGSNFLFHLSSEIYPWLLLWLTTRDDIAIYGVLVSVSRLVNPALTAMGSYLLPLFVRQNKDYKKVNRMVRRWVILFGILSMMLILIGIFFGQGIINILYSEKYANLGMIVIFPFVIQGINIIFQPFKIALNAIKRTDVHFWVLIPRSLISIVLGILLINTYGIAGVFYTMIVENTFYQMAYYFMYRRIIHNPKRTAVDG